jgi:hypothetical protein
MSNSFPFIHNFSNSLKPFNTFVLHQPQNQPSTLLAVTTKLHNLTRMSSDLTAEVQQTPTGMRVLGAERLDYRFHYISPVFDVSHAKLAETYKPWKRVLIVIDQSK